MKRFSSLSLLLFSVICCGPISSQGGFSQEISFDFEEESLSFILLKLDEITDIDIRYNKSLLPESRFSYSFKNTPLKEVLHVVLRPADLDYYTYALNRIVVVPKEILGKDTSVYEFASIDLDDVPFDSLRVGETVLDSRLGEYLIRGTVVDSRTYEPISNVLIKNMLTGVYQSTSPDGSFQLNAIFGHNPYQLSSIAYNTKNLVISVYESGMLQITLDPKAYLIDELIISGSSSRNKLKDPALGLEQLSPKDIKSMGGLLGEADVVKSLLNLAGVSNSGDGSSGFNVRGGSVDQNLILLNGASLYNPNHILGFFSAFNPDIIRTTELHKGHIPSNYGGRVSSVLDITLKDPTREYVSIKGSLGMISSKLSLEMPLIKTKNSILLSYRKSYAGWLLTQVSDVDVKKSKAEFYDLNLGFSHEFNKNQKLTLSIFQSDDFFRFSNKFGYSWTNRIGTLDFRHLLSNSLSYLLRASSGKLKNSHFQPEGPLAFYLDSGIKYEELQAEMLWTPGSHVIKSGFEFRKTKMIDENLIPFNDSEIKSLHVQKDNADEFSFYFADQLRISDVLSLDLGIRYTNFSQLGPGLINKYSSFPILRQEEIYSSEYVSSGRIIRYGRFEPRISLSYSLSKTWGLKAFYNRLNQFVHLLSNTTTPTPTDIWQLSNHYIKPLQTDNYSVGLVHKLAHWELTFDIYYKNLFNTLDYKDFAELLLNDNIESQLLFGQGRNYGSELSLITEGERLSARFSYTFSKSENKTWFGQGELINGGQWYPSSYDQPHAFKLFANYNISRRDKFTLNFTYNTGHPMTAPIGTYLLQNLIVTDFSRRNEYRIPAYHRLDLSYTLIINRRQSARFKSDLTFSLYNFYGRKNVFSIFYRQETGSVVNASKLSVIGSVVPSISYNFQF